MASVNGMSGTIERAREVLSDPDSAMAERVHLIGVLAIFLIATDSRDAVAEEARGLVLAFWQGMAVTR